MASSIASVLNNQLFNMAFVMGSMQLVKNWDLTSPDVIFKLRVTYVACQALVLATCYGLIALIKSRNDITPLRYVEPRKPSIMDPNPVDPNDAGLLIETTNKDYDIAEIKKVINSTLVAMGILGVMHLQFKFVQPLFIQSILPIKNTIAHKVVQIHLWGLKAEGDLKRPFKVDSPFGLGGDNGPKTDKTSLKKAEKAAGITSSVTKDD